MKAIFAVYESCSGDTHEFALASFDPDHYDDMVSMLEEMKQYEQHGRGPSFTVYEYNAPIHNPKQLQDFFRPQPSVTPVENKCDGVMNRNLGVDDNTSTLDAPSMSLTEAKAECFKRVCREYEMLEANVDLKYLSAGNYQTCINNVASDMVREGLIGEDQVAAIKDQPFP
jgi:hypothetical protein